MKKGFHHINATLIRLEKIQANHIESFNTEILPDLEHQMIERNEAFRILKKDVGKFLKDTGPGKEADTESMMYIFIERINTLITQNKALEKKVIAHRNGLRESMKRMSIGKKIIGSYGSPSSVSNRPRAINFTN